VFGWCIMAVSQREGGWGHSSKRQKEFEKIRGYLKLVEKNFNYIRKLLYN